MRIPEVLRTSPPSKHRRAVLLLGILLLTPSLIPATTSMERRRQEKIREARTVMAAIEKDFAGLRPVLRELDALTASYDAASPPLDIERRRKEVHRRYRKLWRRLRGDRRRFFGLMKELKNLSFLSTFQFQPDGTGRFARKGADIAVDVAELYRFRGSMSDLTKEADAAFRREKEGYDFLMKRLQERERVKRMWAACSLILLALSAALLWAWRRRRRIAAEETALLPAVPPARSAPVRLAQSPRAAPTRLLGGSYRVEAELGAELYMTVFEAQDLAAGRRVVIKRFCEGVHSREKDLERLLGALRRQLMLEHQSLEGVYSVFIEEELVHMAVERIEGRRLSGVIRSGGLKGFEAVRHSFNQVLRACEYAHGKGFLHGSLHSRNVMVAGDGRTKLMNLGVEVLAQKASIKTTRPAAREDFGHLSPEQETGQVTERSDIYSLGVLLYEMVAGRRPFTGREPLKQKLRMDYRPPSETGGAPKELDPVVHTMLQPDPGKRYGSVSEAYEMLARIPCRPA